MPTIFSEQNETTKKKLIKLFKIREIKAVGYSKDGHPLMDGKPIIIEKYNQQGELVESYTCLEGTPEVRKTFSIDEAGSPITTYCYDGVEFHTYDFRQKLLERKTYSEKRRIKEWIRYEYEKPSAEVEVCREFSYKKKYHGKTVSKSDEQGNVLFEAFYDAFDEPIGKSSYQYNADYKLIRTVEWGVLTRRARPSSLARYLGLLYSENRFEYDGKGNLVKKFHFDIDETVNCFQSEFYRYDLSDRKIEEHGFDENGTVTWRQTFDYDPSGNLVSMVYTGADGNKAYSRSWQYDDRGLETILTIEDCGENLKNRYVFSYEYY